jgi:hypothetical protein
LIRRKRARKGRAAMDTRHAAILTDSIGKEKKWVAALAHHQRSPDQHSPPPLPSNSSQSIPPARM